jgi:hypothetical protein
MEDFCLENHFVFELCCTRGFPLKEASELGFLYNKGIISGINCVIVLYIFLFLLMIVITILLMLCIRHLIPYIEAVRVEAFKRGCKFHSEGQHFQT